MTLKKKLTKKTKQQIRTRTPLSCDLKFPNLFPGISHNFVLLSSMGKATVALIGEIENRLIPDEHLIV